MKKKSIIKIIIAALLLAAAATSLGIVLISRYHDFFVSRKSKQQREELEQLLAEADESLSLGFSDRAFAALRKALDLDLNEYSLLRVLKRALDIAEIESGYDRLEALSGAALELIPGSPALCSIYIYSLLRAGRPSKAEEIENMLKSSLKARGDPASTTKENIYYLWAEQILRAGGGLNNRSLSPPPRLQKLILLSGQDDPDRLLEIADELQDERILIDAALLWMKQGQPDRAFELTQQRLGAPAFDEPAAFIAFDAGQLEASKLRFERLRAEFPERTDFLQMLSDICLSLKLYEEAKSYYHRVIMSDPDFSWKAYLNLSWLLEQEGDYESALFYMKKARSMFPDQKRVIITLAEALYQRGAASEALQALKQLLEADPEDLEANLLLLELTGCRESPIRYQASLWQLYNRFPHNELIARILTRYLLEAEDLEGARIALKLFAYHSGTEKPPWFLQYCSFLAALEGNYAEASRIMAESLILKDSWRGRYNHALILGAGRQQSQAIEELMRAESLLNGDAGIDRERYRSIIRSKLGQFYLDLGDAASARRELQYAAQLDRDNLYPRLLLKNLEQLLKK